MLTYAAVCGRMPYTGAMARNRNARTRLQNIGGNATVQSGRIGSVKSNSCNGSERELIKMQRFRAAELAALKATPSPVTEGGGASERGGRGRGQ